LKKQTRII